MFDFYYLECKTNCMDCGTDMKCKADKCDKGFANNEKGECVGMEWFIPSIISYSKSHLDGNLIRGQIFEISVPGLL